VCVFNVVVVVSKFRPHAFFFNRHEHTRARPAITSSLPITTNDLKHFLSSSSSFFFNHPQRYKWDIDRSVDAFFSGTYEKEIEGVSDAEIDEKTGELKEGENGRQRQEQQQREERMTIDDDSASEYNTGDDDPDFVEIDSDEEMERLIMNPRDERARERAERQIVDLTGSTPRPANLPVGSGDHRHSARRAIEQARAASGGDGGRANGNLSHMMRREAAAGDQDDFIVPEGIDLEEAKQLEAAMFGVAYEAPAARRPIDPSQPLPFVDMNASDDVLRSRFEKYEQDAAFQESLRLDREKETKRVLEEHKKLLEKEEAEAKEKKRRVEAERHIEEAKSTLEEEPPAGAPDVVTIRLTFPNGEKLQRRFLKTHALKNMFAYIDSNSTAEPEGGPHKVLPKTYRLVANHPRREIEYSSEGTIGSMTSSSMEAFFVELLPE